MMTFICLWLAASVAVFLGICCYQGFLCREQELNSRAYSRLIRAKNEKLSLAEAAVACLLKGDFAGASWLVSVLTTSAQLAVHPAESEVEMLWACYPGLAKHDRLNAADLELLRLATSEHQLTLAHEIIIGRHKRAGFACPQVPDIYKAVAAAGCFLRKLERSEETRAVMGCLVHRAGSAAMAA